MAVLTLSRSAASQAVAEVPADRDAIARALDAPSAPVASAGAALEVPPLPPRRRGLSLEASLGVMGFASKLRTVSPMASRFRLQIGYDFLRWLMLFASSELAFTSTRYAPPSRGYSIVALGGGARGTVAMGERWAVYVQGELGVTEVTTNVLHSYGYFGAETFAPYLGGVAGLEWYALDPHYALALAGGVRSLPGFSRSVGSDAGLAWLGSAAIRYTF